MGKFLFFVLIILLVSCSDHRYDGTYINQNINNDTIIINGNNLISKWRVTGILSVSTKRCEKNDSQVIIKDLEGTSLEYDYIYKVQPDGILYHPNLTYKKVK